jgi:hypothetical protein
MLAIQDSGTETIPKQDSRALIILQMRRGLSSLFLKHGNGKYFRIFSNTVDLVRKSCGFSFFSQRSVPQMVSSLVDESTLTCGMFWYSLAYILGWSILWLASDGRFVDADRNLQADAAARCRKLVECVVLQICLAPWARIGRSDWLHAVIGCTIY